jgi:hypothetical protein
MIGVYTKARNLPLLHEDLDLASFLRHPPLCEGNLFGMRLHDLLVLVHDDYFPPFPAHDPSQVGVLFPSHAPPPLWAVFPVADDPRVLCDDQSLFPPLVPIHQ